MRRGGATRAGGGADRRVVLTRYAPQINTDGHRQSPSFNGRKSALIGGLVFFIPSDALLQRAGCPRHVLVPWPSRPCSSTGGTPLRQRAGCPRYILSRAPKYFGQSRCLYGRATHSCGTAGRSGDGWRMTILADRKEAAS